MRVCVRVCVGAFNAGEQREKEIADKGINRNIDTKTDIHSAMCAHWSSQPLANKPFLCGVRPVLPAATQTHTRKHTSATTDVTRIQEGVAAYYILTAHTRCLAWLGLFKRLRLDKQRGFCFAACSSHLLLPVSAISHRCSCFFRPLTCPMHRKEKKKPHTNDPELSSNCKNCRIVGLIDPGC